MNYVFYDSTRVICGISEVMYKTNWYLCLYANTEYVIIYYRNQYVKLDKYDVEDCEYNTCIFDGEFLRQANISERNKLTQDGLYILNTEYDMDSIEACKNDLELIKTNDLKLYFVSGMLTRVEDNSDNTILQNKFKNIVNAISELPCGETRRGLNIIFIECLESWSYSLVNGILRKYNIYTDNEAIRCLDYRFIMELVYILEGEVGYE